MSIAVGNIMGRHEGEIVVEERVGKFDVFSVGDSVGVVVGAIEGGDIQFSEGTSVGLIESCVVRNSVGNNDGSPVGA